MQLTEQYFEPWIAGAVVTSKYCITDPELCSELQRWRGRRGAEKSLLVRRRLRSGAHFFLISCSWIKHSAECQMLSLFYRLSAKMLVQRLADLQSLRQQSGWPPVRGERVLRSSVAVNFLSSETADKDVKRSIMKETCEPQIAKLWMTSS